MTRRSTDEASTDRLVKTLADDVTPVTPLASPGRRAAATLAVVALVGVAGIGLSNTGALLARHAGREGRLATELAAILATGVLAVVAAFYASVPGRGRKWIAAPVLPLAAWLLLSGAGCYADVLTGVGAEVGAGTGNAAHSLHCFVFISAASAGIAIPLAWTLARARPVEALRTALLAGLGSAALAAFLLAFYHPFAVTFFDLAVHLVTMLLVTGVVALFRGPAFRPA